MPKALTPYFETTYAQALTDAGIAHDVYDVDARGRRAPSAVGVLSHYDAVIWETGGDLYTREPAQPGGTGVSKLLDDMVLAVRDYMNAGGNVMYAGKEPLQGVRDQFLYNPDQEVPGAPWCKSNQTTGQNDADDPVGQENNCIALSNDFLQYWLGAYIPAGAALTEQMKEDPAIGDTVFGLNGPGSVSDAPLLQSFLTTTSLIPDYPEFAAGTDFGSDRAIAFDRKPSFDPPTGDWYMSSGASNYGYKRLTRTVDLTGRDAAELAFKFSFDTEPGYDFVFVEARSVGGTDWKTLPDANGHTDTDVGVGCTEGSDYWLSAHPHLREYIVREGVGNCHEVVAGQLERGHRQLGRLPGLARRPEQRRLRRRPGRGVDRLPDGSGLPRARRLRGRREGHLRWRHSLRHLLRGRPRRLDDPRRASRQPGQHRRLGAVAERRPGRRTRSAHRPLDHLGLRPRSGRRRRQALGAAAQRDAVPRSGRLTRGCWGSVLGESLEGRVGDLRGLRHFGPQPAPVARSAQQSPAASA